MPQKVRAIATLAGSVVVCWLGWMGWDRHRDYDPVTHSLTGPYEPWQVVGCVVCLVVVAVVASRWLPVRMVVTIMPVVFTGAWSISAASDESVGANLWPLGAGTIFAGMVLGTAIVATPARSRWRRRRRGGAGSANSEVSTHDRAGVRVWWDDRDACGGHRGHRRWSASGRGASWVCGGDRRRTSATVRRER